MVYLRKFALLSPLVIASTIFAGVGPISYNDTGLNITVTTVGPDTWLTGISGVNSTGGIMPNESGSNWIGTVNGASTWDYCVDDQRDVNVPGTYTANVLTLADISNLSPSNLASDVNLGSSSSSGWTNQVAGANTALARYEMAAYLISNFTVASDGTLSGGSDGLSAAAVAKNQAIQAAIWTLTNNSSYGSSGISGITNADGTTLQGSSTPLSQTVTPNLNWIQLAEANYQTVNLNNWAVVSFTGLNGSLAGVQTLMVEVLPEPSYVVLLVMGLGALVFFRKRIRTA